jgi:hypothetical protein
MIMQFSPQSTPPSDDEVKALLQQLRRKEGSWVDWGKGCQQLQKAGYSAQSIFSETGIEAAYQNLTIVAAQVFDSLVQQEAAADLLTYCQGPRSDVLYELRVLNQSQRLAAAALAMEKRLDVDEARQLAQAMKAFGKSGTIPTGFTTHPGDAVAYQAWRLARAKKDLQERSRLIAQGLKFAHSDSARRQIEALLSDFTVTPMQRAPLLPLFRLEQEDELPRLIPVAGQMPLTAAQVQGVAAIEEIEPFRIATITTPTQCVPIPGWQAVLKAQDAIAILCRSDELPNAPDGPTEEVVVIVDRAVQDWQSNAYWLTDQGDRAELHWFSEAPTVPILGQIVLILRPKRILDEGNLTQPWQMDD